MLNIPGRLAEAKNDFETLLETLRELFPEETPQLAKALLQLGRTCAKLNDSAQAKKYLQEAMVIDQKMNVFNENERAELNNILK